MLISVIIPVYQAKNSLEKCVQSIPEDYSEQVEIILVDDGSTDGTSEICDMLVLKRRNVCACHQKNHGVSAARNKGIELAKGKYLMFLDADDCFVKERWRTIIDYAKKEIDFVAFSYYSWFSNGQLVKEPFPNNTIIDDYDKLMNILLGTPLLHTCWGKLFKKSIIVENQIAFPKNVTIGEDYIFVMEYCKYIKSHALINSCVIKYYQNSGGAMGNFQLRKRIENLNSVWSYCKTYVLDEQRKKYQNVMLLYQFISMVYIMRMLVEKMKGWEKYQGIKKMMNTEVVREIIQRIPINQLHKHRKIEYFCIRYRLWLIATLYFDLKVILKKREHLLRKV